ncbi:F0F1 ATP synthase subunit delta [Tropicimonas sp. IMCC6043]|uniref:F0F1 ATP synthase subunit delta n=1 Tax=Tropicimonas sp. IMCC6043 TaxID=2510645 RepID=UPI00101C3A70|nr:F0F1 ATP synthase subunit delta [Tropicimonas sp. IMCC6043]RYH07034.1 hypothetical protein EU800_21645 [Tropicimonas sp. IMCC6043]
MTIDWWTLGLQTVNLLILIWILARYLFRPVARIIAERQAATHAALDEARAAREEAEAARATAKTETAEIARIRAELLSRAQEDAKHERAHLLETARAEAEKARAETRAELARLREAQKEMVAEEAGALAADIAGRLVGRLPDTVKIDGFMDGLVGAVSELPEATRTGIGAAGPVSLRAARALTGDERTVLETRLADLLGRTVTLEIEEAPELIAGLELDARHAIVRNHFRADLDRIKSELANHD